MKTVMVAFLTSPFSGGQHGDNWRKLPPLVQCTAANISRLPMTTELLVLFKKTLKTNWDPTKYICMTERSEKLNFFDKVV